jgi:MFS family permease
LFIETSDPKSLGKPFNRLFASSLASNLADGLLKTAAPLLAVTLTRDPFLIGLLSAVVMLPWLLFAIPIGALVDRVDRKQAMAAANLIRIAVAAFVALSISLGFMSFWLLFFCTLLIGIAEVAYDTAAQALVPQVLRADQLERGNSRLEIGAVTLGEFFGAPISGLLFAAAIALPFYLGTAGIVVALILVLIIPGQYGRDLARADGADATTPDRTRLRQLLHEIREGISYLLKSAVLRGLVVLTTSVSLTFSFATATQVLFAIEIAGVPLALFGFLAVFSGVGALIGSALAPALSTRFGRTQVMSVVLIASSALIFVTGFVTDPWSLSLILLGEGAAIAIWNVLLMSTYQQLIPNELFGRIHGARRTLVWGVIPIGSVLGGLVAQIDLRFPLWIGGLLSLLIVIAGWRFLRGLSVAIGHK